MLSIGQYERNDIISIRTVFLKLHLDKFEKKNCISNIARYKLKENCVCHPNLLILTRVMTSLDLVASPQEF